MIENKLRELANVAALVPDGATLSLGGFTTPRHPMAFVVEMQTLFLGDWPMVSDNTPAGIASQVG